MRLKTEAKKLRRILTLTKTMLLGNVATARAVENKVLEYGAINMRFTNDDGASAYLDKECRRGFGLSSAEKYRVCQSNFWLSCL
jgi:hypothetical protein|tara:strand:+ start:1433 stop:1684 length:252 start_codon:yes stop_codon:yes gene_type:complete